MSREEDAGKGVWSSMFEGEDRGQEVASSMRKSGSRGRSRNRKVVHSSSIEATGVRGQEEASQQASRGVVSDKTGQGIETSGQDDKAQEDRIDIGKDSSAGDDSECPAGSEDRTAGSDSERPAASATELLIPARDPRPSQLGAGGALNDYGRSPSTHCHRLTRT